jgi:murein DD-endopeptidase MepM/ murein hydrolase activator NlpD
MSHRSVSSLLKHSHQFARAAAVGPQAAVGFRSDFAFVHGGRQLRLGPIAFWIVVGTLVIMAVWTITTATYFAFRDDVLARLIARETEMQFAYEDRISDLRTQIDRITSRQLLDQEQYESKLDQILRRQATLEQRASALHALPDAIVTGSVKPPARGEPQRSAPFRPSPISNSSAPAGLPERGARLDGGFAAARLALRGGGVEATLARVTAALDRVEARQAAALNALEESYILRVRRIRGVLAEAGVDAAKLAGISSGVGGPFVPARLSIDPASFERQMQRISIARGQVDRLTHTLVSVPLRKPVVGELDLSSGFGVRLDPFIRAAAMHTGIDFRGETGEPVRVTATGTVTAAGWSGGYGRMVEVDHGSGFVTRYGHLSAIEVKVGQVLKIGQTVGRLGSTGRSTGPHLHYETRVDGEAVDPQKFLRAGMRLGSVN